MPALRTLGLVILAALAVSIGILGYVCIRAVFDESAARNAAIKVADACGTVIASGGVQTVEVTIPGNYHMSFDNYQIVVDNYRVPESGFVRQFVDGIPDLDPGTHQLSITMNNENRLVVTRIL